MKEENVLKKMFVFWGKILIAILVMVAFYKLPTIIADKVTYAKIKKRIHK